MPKAKIDDCEIYYEIHGSGPPVLLVAGLGGEGAYWEPQIETLSRHFQLIVHDHRGTGQSTRQKIDYSVDQMAADVIKLMNALGIDKAHLVGHSTGGAIGQILGIENPSRLLSLFIYASWTKSDPFMQRVMQIRKALIMNVGARAYIQATPVFLHPDWWINANWEKIEAAEKKSVSSFPDPEIVASRIDAILAFDRSTELGQIRTPTLVFCAEDDFLTPLYASQDLAVRIPGAKLLVVKKGGHAHSQTMHEEFNKIVVDYILEQEQRLHAPELRAG
jgi:aminoacrylate hydrolase